MAEIVQAEGSAAETEVVEQGDPPFDPEPYGGSDQEDTQGDDNDFRPDEESDDPGDLVAEDISDKELVDLAGEMKARRDANTETTYLLTEEATDAQNRATSFADATLKQADIMRAEGAPEDLVAAYIETEKRRWEAEEMRVLAKKNKALAVPVKPLERRTPVSDAEALAIALADPHFDLDMKDIPESLRFPVLFYNSPEFLGHLSDALVEEAGRIQNDRGASAKAVELAYRTAVLRTLGLNPKQDKSRPAVGEWKSKPPPEPAVEFQIELMRESAENSRIDMIMTAREVGLTSGRAYTQQWKSYQKTAKKSSSIYDPYVGDGLLIERVGSITPDEADIEEHGQEKVLTNAFRLLQSRVLYTGIYADTTPVTYLRRITLSSGDKEGEEVSSGQADFVDYRTKFSREEGHKAIYEADPAEVIRSAKVVESGRGKGGVRLTVPVDTPDGPREIEVRTPFKGTVDDDGNLVITKSRAGDIGVVFPQEACFDLHRLTSISEGYAETILNVLQNKEYISKENPDIQKAARIARRMMDEGLL